MLAKEKRILFKKNSSNVIAAIFVLKKDGSVLLQHRDNKSGIRDPNIWGPPGGHLEDNETELSCAKRELSEETTYKVENLTFLKSVFDTTPNQPVIKVSLFWCLYDYIQVPKCNEGQDLRFVSRLEASSLPIKKFIIKAWDDALTEANISVKLPLVKN